MVVRIVEFVKSCSPYRGGERAGFSPHVAAKLVQEGSAVYVDADLDDEGVLFEVLPEEVAEGNADLDEKGEAEDDNDEQDDDDEQVSEGSEGEPEEKETKKRRKKSSTTKGRSRRRIRSKE